MSSQLHQGFFSLSEICKHEHLSRSIVESMLQDPRFPVIRMTDGGRFYIPRHAISYMTTVDPIADDMSKWSWDWDLPEPKLLTITQFRRFIGCSETTVYDAIRSKGLTTKMVAKRIFIVTENLQTWLDNRCRSEHNLKSTRTRRKK